MCIRDSRFCVCVSRAFDGSSTRDQTAHTRVCASSIRWLLLLRSQNITTHTPRRKTTSPGSTYRPQYSRTHEAGTRSASAVPCLAHSRHSPNPRRRSEICPWCGIVPSEFSFWDFLPWSAVSKQRSRPGPSLFVYVKTTQQVASGNSPGSTCRPQSSRTHEAATTVARHS